VAILLSDMKKANETRDNVRLDLWLWAARFFKTRSLAKQAIESGKVEVAGQDAKPSRALRVGELLVVHRGQEKFEIEVLALSDIRGSATVAQTLYRESAESRQKRESEREMRRLENAGYRAPDSKPDKRARRLIRALGDIDAI
jgi:ribosome-associated heat shock protein Hsp15